MLYYTINFKGLYISVEKVIHKNTQELVDTNQNEMIFTISKIFRC